MPRGLDRRSGHARGAPVGIVGLIWASGGWREGDGTGIEIMLVMIVTPCTV